MIKYLYPIIFYILLTIVYMYSKGKFNVGKKEEYKKWVDVNGDKLSKSVVIIGIIYTILYLIQLLGN